MKYNIFVCYFINVSKLDLCMIVIRVHCISDTIVEHKINQQNKQIINTKKIFLKENL